MNFSSLASTSMMWYTIMQSKGMNFFLIPAGLLTAITLIIDPLLLFCIFSNASLRQETRYLLLANALLSDVLFLIVNIVNVIYNALDVDMHYMVCEVVMVTTITTYCSSMLTVTLMVTDTFVAMRLPLRYNKILTLSRVKKIIGMTWVVSATYPLVLLVVMEVSKKDAPQNLKVCLVLIALASLGESIKVGLHIYFAVWTLICIVLTAYCYIRLYCITKDSGIWRPHSRARQTLLVHTVMFLIYFTPGIVFTFELALFETMFSQMELAVWLNTVNLTVLMVVPRACAPYLYGLRYHEIYNTVQVLLRKRPLSQLTIR